MPNSINLHENADFFCICEKKAVILQRKIWQADYKL